MCVLNLLTACWHSSPWISHFFLWQPLPLNTLMYFILRELYVLLFPVSPCDPCLCLFLLHILDFLNHPADHHLVWPDTTLKSPIHFQTAPSASAYHVFNLYSRPAPPTHTHTLTQSNVFRIQNQLIFSPYHHTCPTLPYHLGSLHTCRLKSDPVTSPSPLGTRCSISFNLLQKFLGTALIFAAALAKNIICTTA